MPVAADPSIVEAPVRDAQRTLKEAHDAVFSSLTEALQDLQVAAAAARDAHDVALRRLRDAPPDDRSALRAALQAYRATTMREGLAPLADAFDGAALGPCLVDQRATLQDAREALSDGVPATLKRPEPAALHAPAADDTAWHHLQKYGKRTLRAAQDWIGRDGPTQIIPMAKLVDACARGPLARAHAAALQALEQTAAKRAARIERAAAAWMHAVLTAEHVLHSPTAESAASDAPGDPTPRDASSPADDLSSQKASTREASTGEASTQETPKQKALLEPVWRHADALQDGLREMANLTLQAAHDALRTDTEDALNALREAAEHAGSVGGPSLPLASRKDARTHEAWAERAAHWPAWWDQVVERLRFLQALGTLRDASTDAQAALEEVVRRSAVEAMQALLHDGIEALRETRATVDRMLENPDPGREGALVRRFEHLRDAAHDALVQRLLDPLHALHARRDVGDAVERQLEALRNAARAQPKAFTVHALPPADADDLSPDVSSHTIQWHTIARDALGAPFADAWEAALTPLLRELQEETEDIEEVQTILQFNLGAALEELQDHAMARRRGAAASTHVADARVLALDGLTRCIQTLRAVSDHAEASQVPFVRATRQASATAWERVHNRARAAGGARAQVLRAQSWMARQVRMLADAAAARLRWTSIVGKRATHRGTRLVNALIRKGRTAVGSAVDDASVRETVEALSTVEGILDTLPLVYHRLFSFRPVMDPALLMGRDEDLRFVAQHIKHWRSGLNNALVVTGPAGSGRTSLLNVLRTTHLRGAERYTLDLQERLLSEADLAQAVAHALNLPMEAPPATLHDVASAILSEWRTDAFRVGLVENLEHVFLRTIGGSDVTARFLQFLSSTDSRVLWIVTCSTAGWQSIAASQPRASTLVDHHPLDPLDRNELEALVMRRHRRSGLPLTFEPPSETAAPLLARRLRGVDAETRQDMLRDEYFSRLHDLCGQNVMLALAYWFRSLRLEDDRLYIEPLRPIQFDMLDRFSVDQSFALKALLEHATLTISELAEVAQISEGESHALLESLGNALLITPVDGLHSPGVFRFYAIEHGVRYRIRPLVIHPVTRHLRSRNIVHG